MKKRSLFITFHFVTAISFCQAQSPTLWGMTGYGGFNNFGTIFRYNISTGEETVEHKFELPNGISPRGSLTEANNRLLYGMTYTSGGDNFGEIFSYDISTSNETDLYGFGIPDRGYGPVASLIQASNGLLYGMTLFGPDTFDSRGMIFSYDISTGTETNLHYFGHGLDGYSPYGSLMEASDGLLYGMTVSGGAKEGAGTIFSYDISKDTEIIVHNFGGSDGAEPYGSLVQASNGLLYGMTQYGGKYNKGVIFNFDITTDSENVIHDLGAVDDGKLPFGSLIQANNGLLYGMTSKGGPKNRGTIFSYDIDSNKEMVLHNFVGDSDGAIPQGSLMQASDGLIYGMTVYGGANDSGIIFSFDIDSKKEKVIHNFDGIADGRFPTADLIEVDSFPVTGINQLSYTSNKVQLYPNPSSTNIHLSLKLQSEQSVNLSLYNTISQEVWSKNLGKTKDINTSIPLGNLASGIYILKVNSGNESQQREVVVEKYDIQK